MNTCNYTYSEMYFSQLFTTLGTVSAVLVSGSVAVPMISYYSGSLVNLYSSLYQFVCQSLNKETEEGERAKTSSVKRYVHDRYLE